MKDLYVGMNIGEFSDCLGMTNGRIVENLC